MSRSAKILNRWRIMMSRTYLFALCKLESSPNTPTFWFSESHLQVVRQCYSACSRYRQLNVAGAQVDQPKALYQ